jgi:hypothetical protein
VKLFIRFSWKLKISRIFSRHLSSMFRQKYWMEKICIIAKNIIGRLRLRRDVLLRNYLKYLLSLLKGNLYLINIIYYNDNNTNKFINEYII